jgi:CDP-diacylglycerol--glycerol-3-phosphate 3-phosphatidyltransferase
MEKNDLEIDNLPNRLTFFRILMIPVVVCTLYYATHPADWIVEYQRWLGQIACAVFIVASFTDFLDGYIARKRNLVTVFGSFLDPIADKFLVVASLIMLMSVNHAHPVVVIILVLREMYMTSLRLLALNEGVDVPVSSMGKWKTASQMTAIPLLMYWEPLFGLDTGTIGTVLLYVSAFLSMWSALLYSLSMIKKLKDKRAAKRQLKRELKQQRKAKRQQSV